MKIFRGIDIDETVFTATNAVETVALWNAGTTYAVGDEARSDTTHRIYRSLQASNTNHDPEADVDPESGLGTWWQDVGPTNAWAMFDPVNLTQTSVADAIEVTLEPAGLVNAIALFNLEASSVTVTITDDDAGEVYNETFDLISTGNVGDDFYAWCFEPIIRRTDLHVENLPAYLGAQIDIAIDNPGGMARCGNCVAGAQRQLGETAWGFETGNISYSRRIEDDFGNIKLVRRPSRRRASFQVLVRRAFRDEVSRLLDLYESEPIVFIGTGQFAATIIYGFYTRYDLRGDNVPESTLSITIEGFV
jgi:hypothetical protein